VGSLKSTVHLRHFAVCNRRRACSGHTSNSNAANAKILELAEHASAFRDLACRQAIEHGISVGRGGVWLMLTGEQYGKLK
jgi:hypothetical protein